MTTPPKAAGSNARRATLGVHLMPTAPVGEMVDLARFAEQVGATRCWVNDEGLNTRDPYVTLAAIASQTSTIGLGPGIANPYSRHPGVTAAAIATLDELSGGRAFLGLGAGGSMALGPLGIERRSPARTLEAMIVTTRALLAGETVDHDGPGFVYRRATLAYGRGDLAILVAGRGRRITELAGRVADGFNLGYVHKALLGQQVETLRLLAGDRPFVVTYTTMLVLTDADLEAARAALTFRLIDSPTEVRERVGVTDGHLARIKAGLIEGGPSAAARHVDPDWVSQFMLVGSATEVATELRGLLEMHQIDEFQLPISDPAAGAPLIERVARWLAPDRGDPDV